ncbi:hypothetical protein [Bacillus sp. T33-2]|uniref:hypothetical protein n=1 Tax=Bacillus sp. T33-2 TaxID=2054168 RepID=UPI000C762CEB|nr:hypothetical protein [Bacillus sp. T33-2]PLR98514.1 hypothetical protein CVD19_05430 [Bacillus sp. T33-2]
MRIVGYIVFLIGLWMMVSPQAVLGLHELRWIADYAFPGEAFIGALVSSGSLLLIGKTKANNSVNSH